MKFLQTKITIESYRELRIDTGPGVCPNCGHQTVDKTAPQEPIELPVLIMQTDPPAETGKVDHIKLS